MNNLFRKKVKCSSFSYRQIHFTRTRSCLVLVMLQLVTQCEETTTFSPIEICPDQSLPVEPLQKQQLTHLCRSSQSIMFVLCTHQFWESCVLLIYLFIYFYFFNDCSPTHSAVKWFKSYFEAVLKLPDNNIKKKLLQ